MEKYLIKDVTIQMDGFAGFYTVVCEAKLEKEDHETLFASLTDANSVLIFGTSAESLSQDIIDDVAIEELAYDFCVDSMLEEEDGYYEAFPEDMPYRKVYLFLAKMMKMESSKDEAYAQSMIGQYIG